MKIVVAVAATLIALGLALTAVGAMMPPGHRVTQAAFIPAPIDSVWGVITDIDRYPEWRSGLTRVERDPDTTRVAWRELSGRDVLPLEQVSVDAPRRWVIRIASSDLPFGGTWMYELTKAPNGTRVAITENGQVYNPLFRVLGRYVFGLDATINTYLRDLGRRFNAAETPAAAESPSP